MIQTRYSVPSRAYYPSFKSLDEIADGKHLCEVEREPLTDGEWAWDDFDDRRYLLAAQLGELEAVRLELAFVVNELENRNKAVLDVWLTEKGEEAREALKKGFVWDCVEARIDIERTEQYWRNYAISIANLDPVTRERVMTFLKDVPDERLAHLLPLAAMKLMEKE